MLYHMDSMTLREVSPKFKSCLGRRYLSHIKFDHLQEMAVFLATPGFRDNHYHYLFNGKFRRDLRDRIREEAVFRGLDRLAQANLESITREDGEYLCRMFVRRRHGGMPYWASAWLREEVATRGVGDVASDLGVTAARVQNAIELSLEWGRFIGKI